MRKAHQKLNLYFFGEAEAAAADQVIYYGVFVLGAAMMGFITMI